MQPKVFGIGFHKTGTKSLAKALRILGYRVTGPNGVSDHDIGSKLVSLVDELIPQYDAFQDNPWPLVYEHLDRHCPGSRFILTVRDPQSWIRSQVRFFGRNTTPMREYIYGVGCPEGNEETYLRRYEQHNREVVEYFRGRDDLLVMDFERGDGWERLCPFLGKPVPEEPFPHINKTDAKLARKG